MLRAMKDWYLDLRYCKPWEKAIILFSLTVYFLAALFVVGVFGAVKMGVL